MHPGKKMITKTGLEEWSAPEMLNGIPYDEKVDMWSAGCVFYYMLFGTKPFKSKKTDKLHRSISSGEFNLGSIDIVSKDA
jgi:serine/threonine protein kinase